MAVGIDEDYRRRAERGVEAGAVVAVDGQQCKRSRGMATTAASEARTDKEADDSSPEKGVEAVTPYVGPLADVVEWFRGGIRSGLSYCGGWTIPEARSGATFVRVAHAAREREGAHFDHDWENVTVDDVGDGAGATGDD